ncbi:hypothetical protein ACFOVU_18870 [Nocardiopsis sediminis]|uniref:DUF2530 domain-containing protein n=1 Tax=Nocardiopsis sediminis TaxID=1778267 RepID=A0ABV8FRX2_9ACTN
MEDTVRRDAVTLAVVGLVWLGIGVVLLPGTGWITWTAFAAAAVFVVLGAVRAAVLLRARDGDAPDDPGA